MGDEAPAGGQADSTAPDGASLKTSRSERAAADRAARDAFMSEVPDEYFAKPTKSDAKPEAKVPAAKPAADKTPSKPAPVDEDEDDELEVDDLDGGADEDEDEDDELDKDEHASEGKDDADTTRRMAKVRRAEQRAREQVAAERRKFDLERDAAIREWKPKIEAAQEFEKLKARAKSDPYAALQALGVGEDDLEELSQILYGMSKAGAKDPKYRAAAQQLRQNREMREELRATQERLRTMEERSTKSAAEQETIAARDRYLARVEKSATDETPLLKHELEARPSATREKLRQVALKITERDGEVPDPKKVARAFERLRRKSLERDAPLLERLRGGEAKPAAATPKGATGSTKGPAASGKTPAAALETPINGKSSIPDRKKMIDDLGKLQRGELEFD